MALDDAVRPAAARPLAGLFDDRGYCIDLKLTARDLATLRAITVESWMSVIRELAPEHAGEIEAAGIDNYHLHAHKLDHSRVWTTQTRTYTPAMVETIRGLGLFRVFDAECPGYRIASAMPPYGDLGRPRINWRLVRPGDADRDVGPAHADYWFEAVLDTWTGQPPDIVHVKIWIPIEIETGLTGFAYVPGSHLRRYPFVGVRLPDGGVKPNLDESTEPLPLRTLEIEPGTPVIFSYNLVHRGANAAAARKTRVSMEFTLEVPRASMERLYGDLSRFY